MEIKVDYSVMDAGQDGLTATWNRIEALLADLDAKVAGAGDLQAESLTAYQTLKASWSTGAADRQIALKSLADYVGAARDQYRQVDLAAATMFQVR